MKNLLGACALVVIAGSEASAEYVRAQPGNDAAQAEAYCNMVARGGDRGYFAFGNPDSVAFANGMASLGNAIRRSRTKQDCMTMLGYEWRKPQRAVTSGGSATTTKSGNPSKKKVPPGQGRKNDKP